MPNQLVLNYLNPDGTMAPLQDGFVLQVGHTVIVQMVGGVQKRGEDTMTKDALEVKIPSDGVGCCAGLKKNFHCKAFFSGLIVWIAVVVAVTMLFVSQENLAEIWPWCLGFGGVFWLWHQIDGCCS